MGPGPIGAAESTVQSDIEANARSFARSLRAANKSPNTVTAYLDAVRNRDTFLARPRGMPRMVAAIQREHVEAFIEDHLRPLRRPLARPERRALG